LRSDTGLLRRSLDDLELLQVLLHKVLLHLLLLVQLLKNLRRQAVVNATALGFRDLILRVRAADLVRPLHLLGLNHHAADLSLTVLGRSERNNEVGSFLAIRFEEAVLGIHDELRS